MKKSSQISFFESYVVLIGLISLAGYILNIFKFAAHVDVNNITDYMLLQAGGIIFPPLGIILGFFVW